MTDRLGRYWDQPPTDQILVDGVHAVMTKRTFEALPEYSITCPSGVYPGKMWRRHDGAFDRRPGIVPMWCLCWYGPVKDGCCMVEMREILLA